MDRWEKLDSIRDFCGERITNGLPVEIIRKYLEKDHNLKVAIDRGYYAFLRTKEKYPEWLELTEQEQIDTVQQGLVNYYAADAVNPYIPLAAKGPWIVTSCGAIVHDSGGYGMLCFGHDPDHINEVLREHYVMANVMTPSFSQIRLTNALNIEIGSERDQTDVYSGFVFMNSGSEAVTVGSRISDAHAHALTKEGARHAGKEIVLMALEGGFHGRTDRPAQASDSCLGVYRKNLASFRGRDNLITVKPNDLDGLQKAFNSVEANGQHVECFFMEPVMGEGNPGLAITPEFYELARKLTRDHDSLLLVDSIQAGLRCHGNLSVVDYPGFEKLDPPDLETFSKALNAGQYPLSVLALSERAAKHYVRGTYGNTMTANPRGLEIGFEVLHQVDQDLRRNIRERGKEFLERLGDLKDRHPDIVGDIQGTGLLFSMEISPKVFDVVGPIGLEAYLRHNGLGVIHGGTNSLRFTPHFHITSDEINLMIDVLDSALANAPRK